VTVWAVVDLSTKEGSNLVKNAVNHQIEETQRNDIISKILRMEILK
jgi:hypothetical protein